MIRKHFFYFIRKIKKIFKHSKRGLKKKKLEDTEVLRSCSSYPIVLKHRLKSNRLIYRCYYNIHPEILYNQIKLFINIDMNMMET